MKMTFVTVGSVRKPYIKTGLEQYLKRIGRYADVSLVEVREESSSIKMPREDVLKKEGASILKKLSDSDFNVALSDSGRQMDSRQFSAFIESIISGGKKGVAFVIGGAYGLHQPVCEAADAVVSLSKMTLPHELAFLVLTEQVYRAFTIIRNEPYSH